MSKLFYYNTKFNGHIELWNVSNVTDMKWMFLYAEKFN
jgi:surface protein